MNEQDMTNVEQAYSTLAFTIGRVSALSDAEIENLRGSGPRIARGLSEMVWPREKIIAEVKKALDTKFPVSRAFTDMPQPIVVKPVDTHSLCPHHLLPIVNTVTVAYVPHTHVLGLSKFPRILDALARRAVVQEQYTQDIRQALETGKVGDHQLGEPLSKAVAVNVRAAHHCMICRGVKGRALTETEEVSGEFQVATGRWYQMFSRSLLTNNGGSDA